MNLEPKRDRSNAEDRNLTDADLFLQLQSGRIELLGIIYDRYAAIVYGIAIKLLSNAAEAEDLTQNVFLSLAKSNYDPQRGSLRTYLAIVARSRSIDRLRSRNRQQTARNQSLVEDATVTDKTPLEEAILLERSQEVTEALSRLSQEEKTILQMAYYQGLSQSQIALQLDIPLGTVKSRTRRALIRLRQTLSDSKQEG